MTPEATPKVTPDVTKDRQTLGFYRDTAARYAEWSGKHALPAAFEHFAATLAPASDVLDFGCGFGWAAAAFHARGHRVTALDPVAEMVALVARTPGIVTIRGEAADLPATPAFDAIWASFSLQRIPRAEMPAALARLCGALRPGGRLYIGIHEGTETIRDRLARLYCHWTEAALSDLLAPHGLAITHTSTKPDKGFDGRAFTALHLEALKHG